MMRHDNVRRRPRATGAMLRPLVLLVALMFFAAGDPARSENAAAPAPAAGSAMTHGFGGREDCRSCHLGGTNRARKLPDDHRSYTNETCGGCHQPN